MSSLTCASWNGQGELTRRIGRQKVISGSDKPISLSLGSTGLTCCAGHAICGLSVENLNLNPILVYLHLFLMFLDDEGTASSSGVSDNEGPKACGVQLVASILSNKKKKAPEGQVSFLVTNPF